MFATSFAGLSALACVCSHERSAHVDVAGKRLADGTYLSRGTAEYPASLATEFMRAIQHLGDTTGPSDYALHDAIQLVPRKDLDALPVAFQDGGGMGSIPDWSCPPQGKDNLLLSLRKKWLGMLFDLGFPRGSVHTWLQELILALFRTPRSLDFARRLKTLQLQKGFHPFLGMCLPDSLAV